MDRNFSATLAGLRYKKGLSQRTAAADLRISQALLSHYENGVREPGLEFVSRACDYYGVTADYMLGRSDSETGENAGLAGTAAAAYAALDSALRAVNNNSVALAAERCVTAALLCTASRVAGDDSAFADTIHLEAGAAELELIRSLGRIMPNDSAEAPMLGAEARRLIADIRAKLF